MHCLELVALHLSHGVCVNYTHNIIMYTKNLLSTILIINVNDVNSDKSLNPSISLIFSANFLMFSI